MTELPDYNKITFPEMPPIPLEKIVPDASPVVCHFLVLRNLKIFLDVLFNFFLGGGWGCRGGGGVIYQQYNTVRFSLSDDIHS